MHFRQVIQNELHFFVKLYKSQPKRTQTKKGGRTMKQRSRAKALIASVLSGLLLVQTARPLSALAIAEQKPLSAAAQTAQTAEPPAPLYVAQNTYSDYYDHYAQAHRPDATIRIDAAKYRTATDGTFAVGSYQLEGEAGQNALIWNSTTGTVTYTFAVPQTGVYCAKIGYYPIAATTATIELSLKIDGKTPYDTASRIALNKRWVNETDIYTDSRGNQVRPSQVQSGAWTEAFLQDTDGLFNDPLIFYMEAGVHTLTLDGVKANLALEHITFCQPEQAAPYAQFEPTELALSETPSTLLRLEGEDAAYKSDATLYPTYDNASYLASPSDPTKMVYNTIGGSNWKKATQTITWEIGTHDENSLSGDGWYRIGIKARQSVMRGFYSNRRVKLDGAVVYEELDRVRFDYDTDWSVVTPRDDAGNDIYVYLTAGQPHTLSLEVVPGEIGESMRRLDAIVLDLNAAYREVMMITGPKPDKYTDYEITEKIPGIADEFDDLYTRLEDARQAIEAISGETGTEAAAIERMTVILDKCRRKPAKIPDYLNQIRDNITALSAWMRDYRDQPLELDYIELASADRQFTSADEKFFKQLAFSWKAFVGSFFEDYTTLSDIDGQQRDVLNVWVAQGRDQAQVVKQMTESDFSKETGIPVAVNLVVGGIIEAALADTQPDVALFIGGEFPVNLAARGLLTDLSACEGFTETKDWFADGAMTQYTYENGVYGMPITQSFPMLFYRKDILQELGFSAPPETWDDLIDMLPALQRSYMGVGLVLPPANVSPATEAGHTFVLLTAQAGLSYYNDAQTRTNFDDIRAIGAFERWTELYTKYDFDQTYDAFSRFRTGLYPMVISNYSFANQLSVASPEIKGLWDFTSVPGTKRDDGTVSHAANSNGSAAILFDSAKNKADAFRYVKWFSSADVQTEYGMNIEGLLGQLGRFEAANTAALSRLAWSDAEYSSLAAQQAELAEIPVIPAAYAVTRNIMNAFRETVNNVEANPRDTLMWYNRDINEEIARKRKNLGLSAGD